MCHIALDAPCQAYLQQAVNLIDVWLSVFHRDMAQVEEGELRDHVVYLREGERGRDSSHTLHRDYSSHWRQRSHQFL